MKITKPENLKQFNKFIDNISQDDNLALMHDTDADGISAAVIITKALEKENITIKQFLLQDHSANFSIDQKFLDNLKENKITKLICTDIALEVFQNAEKIKIPVLVIDHHVSKNINTYSNFTVYKPRILQDKLQDSEVCAANLAYNLFQERNDLSDLDWVVSMGIIGDFTFKQEKEFLDKVFKKYEFKEEENIYDTQIGIAIQHITFANCLMKDSAIHKTLNALMTSSNVEETILKLKEFEVVDKEIKRAVAEFDEKSEELFDDLNLYIYESPYKINSPVSTILSSRNINKTYITIQKLNGEYKISARRQDKKKSMAYLLNKSTKDFDKANGGGHIPAAGGKIQIKDFDKFIVKMKQVYANLKEEK